MITVRGPRVAIAPRPAAGPSHDPVQAASAPRGDVDTFYVAAGARRSVPDGSLVYRARVDDNARGAYFHKVVSSARADLHGIRVAGALPAPALDGQRFFVEGTDARTHAAGCADADPARFSTRVLTGAPSLSSALDRLEHPRSGPLDRPSVYLGGRAGAQEVDVGLTWDRVRDDAGRAVFTDLPTGSDMRRAAHRFVVDRAQTPPVLLDGTGARQAVGDGEIRDFFSRNKLQPSFAFRPYWRTSPAEGAASAWNNPPTTPARAAGWAQQSNVVGTPPPNVYFYPEENFAMNVRETAAGVLRLDVRLDGSDAGRAPDFHVSFRASSFGAGAATSWKRVASLDQFRIDAGPPSGGGEAVRRVGNEGHDVLPTSSRLVGARFVQTELLVGAGQTRLPLTSTSPTLVRGADFADAARHARTFNVDVVGGAEILTIRP